jgi:membrane-bound serine protease (ClpP class)
MRLCGRFLLLAALLAGLLLAGPARAAPEIRTVHLAGVINPVTAGFVTAELARANAGAAGAFLLELDTPGGLDTAMREIIQALLGSRVPTIVYVYPAGARAASAGALITLAADFAAMAPGTNIGAAHPVAIGIGGGEKEGPMAEKALNDAVAYARSLAQQRGRNVEWAERMVRESLSTSAVEALELKVIDLVAADEAALLEGLHGRRFLRDGRPLALETRDAVLVRSEMGWRQKILNTISNPNVAYLLLMLGILGIFFEISQPGVILPGALGGIALLLAFFAFQTLPVNYAGVLLILLAIVLFILEIKVTSFGMLTVGGLIALILGSLMLIDSPDPLLQISRVVIVATAIVSAAFFTVVLWFVVRTHRAPVVSGVEGMVGERGTTVTAVHHSGRVFVHGEYWDAFAAGPIVAGEPVEVVRVGPGMRLEVRKVEERNQDSGFRSQEGTES